ncbi:NADH dehydrogenase [ubiquinone] 1 beta subcomplex subunit 7-like [Varroa destructor]|uniref:NADH dehydrogenase [ubiquinone] 1 beta subcomplex subunit 7 n=1 Tax=Varroa destructor TaxID=109461 RepID=A0A7M7JHK4_VARDE|nr:NADH dehydrogenase [ubiquinone] 1 beta subcomplex subunit 7-like [Varroa destructor]
MGNIQFGNTQTLGAYWATSYHEVDPDGYQKPKPLKITHDPMEGFPNGRKPRVMVATNEEMLSARLAPHERDYCAHKLIAFKNCRYQKFPWVALCHREKHDLEHCEFEDFMIRIKEHEREKRLRKRDKERAKKQAREAGNRARFEVGLVH